MALIDWDTNCAWHVLRSQIDLHKVYGGVVPEIAARDHVEHMPKLFEKLMKSSGIQRSDISHIAYTAGPGLIGALLTGSVFATALAKSLNIPAIAVNHMEGHLMMGLMGQDIQFPVFVLLVSGGHSQLMLMKGFGDYELVGRSIDDAAGEAFDKVAKKMGLGYPGGREIEALAREDQEEEILSLPLPLKGQKAYQFSFSGLKTATVQLWDSLEPTRANQARVARAFQGRVVDSFIHVIKRAAKQYQVKDLVISGGVSANTELRQRLIDEAEVNLYAPRLDLCTDNGLMIAYCGGLRAMAGLEGASKHHAVSRWDLCDLSRFSCHRLNQCLQITAV
jgi:N6-L-threonylcarbamoyladenine synthase